MGRIVLIVVGGLWVAFGAACLLAPRGMLALAAIELSPGQAMAEIRAVYGGAQIGFGVFLLLMSRSPESTRAGLLVLALMAGGLALGRLCGVAVDGATDTSTLLALATEVGLFALAALGLRRAPPGLAPGAA